MILYNRKLHQYPREAVWIGRPSRWGNPFMIGKDGDRDEVVDRYLRYAEQKMDDPQWISGLRYLREKQHIVCCCSPLRCHGDALIELIGGLDEFG